MAEEHPPVVVVGIDGSEDAAHALQVAAKEAAYRGAVLRVVVAWSPLDLPDEPGAPEFDPTYDHVRAEAFLHREVARILGDDAGVPVEYRAVNDLPAHALLDQAADADLVVVGSQGKGRIESILLGSVSQKLVQRAPCPVLVVPRPGARDHLVPR